MKPSIAIIGAGISGLETAKNLISSNKFNVKIFEASQDFGGRIRKKEGFCDFALELGGEEIHGMNSEYYRITIKNCGEVFEYWDLNKIYCYYKPNSEISFNYFQRENSHEEILGKIIEKKNNTFNNSDKNEKNNQIVNRENYNLENMYELTRKYPEIDFMNKLFEDISYEISLKNLPNISLKEYLQMNKIPEESFFYADALIGNESGTDLNKISIKGFAKVCEEWQSGTENLLLVNMSHYDILEKNYSEILQKSIINDSYNNHFKYADKCSNVEDLNNSKTNFFIQYNTQITEINYEDKNKIVLYDQKNNSYEFDLCIFCVPIPQYKLIKFRPQFSQQKLDCLNNIGFDSVGKLFLKFSKLCWPEDAVVILVPGLANFFWPSNIGKNSKEFVLNCLIGGENCKTLTKLYKNSKNEFLEKLFEPLKISLGNDIRDYLLDFIWFDWTEMPFIGGGYSFTSVNENENDRNVLGEAIENRIFFAGEAFAKNGHIATIHGAMESAKELCNYILEKF